MAESLRSALVALLLVTSGLLNAVESAADLEERGNNRRVNNKQNQRTT